MKRIVVLAALCAAPAYAAPRLPLFATVPSGFSDSVFATGLSSPVAMAFAPDGRLFVCQKGGQVRIITAGGALLATPFLSLTVETGGERGLLGIAFDPQFASNGWVYLYYTLPGASIHNRVSRFTASGDAADPATEVPLLDLDPVTTMYHNAGALHFGLDGRLYVAVGDGGPSSYSQMLSNRFGKLLRINSDGSIPVDNPASFPGIGNVPAGPTRAIWAIGLRNPFTFAVQPGTGRIFANDVGMATWEEVNEVVSGANLGWPVTEGDFDPVAYPNYRRPLHVYGRDGAAQGPTFGECISGGTFYPSGGTFPPAFHGQYFFSDHTNRWIRTLDPATGATALFAEAVNGPVDLDVGSDGALYYLEFAGGAAGLGRVGRIAYTAGQPPSITLHPADVTVPQGQPAGFSVSAAGSAPLAYRWQRDGADLAGATSDTCTVASPVLADTGARFRCVVTNAYGTATSSEAVLTVTSNQPPAPQITSPAPGSTYRGGDTVLYSGTASDPEDGALGAAAFTWRIDFHHGTHLHPFVPDTTGAAGGSFTVPASGETATDVWYRITLTVVDSQGVSASVVRDILPTLSSFTLATDPPGLQVTLDGQPTLHGTVVDSVVGMARTLGGMAQTAGGVSYEFVAWSDGGAMQHDVVTPDVATTYTATYRLASARSGSGGSGSDHGSCGLTGLEAVLLLVLFAARRRAP